MKKFDVDKLIFKSFGSKTGRFNHFLSLLIVVVGLLGCNSKNESSIAQNEAGVVEPIDTICSCPQCVIKLLPYNDFTKQEAKSLLPKLQEAFDKWLYGSWKFEIMEPAKLPQNSFVKERNRYRVTPILNYQSKQIKGNEVIIGLTHKDICTNIHGKKDYGIIGISRLKKQVCLVSDKRLKDKSLYWKPILHEFMHTFYGAKHCPNDDPKCFMKDAKGHGNFEIQDKLCDSCKY